MEMSVLLFNSNLYLLSYQGTDVLDSLERNFFVCKSVYATHRTLDNKQ